MTDSELRAEARKILELSEAADRGPWQLEPHGVGHVVRFDGNGIVGVTLAPNLKNRVFIAAVRTSAPLLAEAVERLICERDQLHSALDSIRIALSPEPGESLLDTIQRLLRTSP